MSNPTEQQQAARARAQTYFTQTEKRDAMVREEIEKERAATAAKTAKLRAMRLAREAAEREEAAKQPARVIEPVKRPGRKKKA